MLAGKENVLSRPATLAAVIAAMVAGVIQRHRFSATDGRDSKVWGSGSAAEINSSDGYRHRCWWRGAAGTCASSQRSFRYIVGKSRSDEAHVTTPGVPIIELRRTGGPIVCNELPERRTGVVREPRREALSFSLGPVTGS